MSLSSSFTHAQRRRAVGELRPAEPAGSAGPESADWAPPVPPGVSHSLSCLGMHRPADGPRIWLAVPGEGVLLGRAPFPLPRALPVRPAYAQGGARAAL